MAGRWLSRVLDRFGINGRDAVTILTSLLLAFSIWMLLNLRKPYSMTLAVPVIAESNMPGYFLRSDTPTVVEARVRASGYRLIHSERLFKKPQLVRFDPSLLTKEEDGRFSITANELSSFVEVLFGSEVSLESFTSPSYSFRFPEENHKVVPVRPVATFDFKPQYMSAEGMKIEPDSVIVYGESQYLDNVAYVTTRRLQLSKVSRSMSGDLRLEEIRNVRLSTKTVNYSLDVTRYVSVRKTVDITTRNVPAGKRLSIYPSTAEVTFRCVFPVVDDNTGNVPFFIDYNDFIRSINGRCIARTDALPKGIIDWTIEPQVFDCVENL